MGAEGWEALVNARNERIVEARAAGRTLQSIAVEHGLSVARVSKVVQDHRLELRVAELERENRMLREFIERQPGVEVLGNGMVVT